ncbi:hypothetical protein GW932_03445 [archaeon]|nr:hypothetical protein [archaeon]
MKLIEYHTTSKTDFHSLIKYYDENRIICGQIEQEYGENGLWFHTDKLNNIRKFLKNDLENKFILDLACGSTNSEYKPWLARGLYKMGINIIGIDINDNSKEKFENYKIDLSVPNSLNFLKDNSIDIAMANYFFIGGGLKTSNKKTFNLLLPQLERIVKKEGYFIYDTCNSGI